LAPEPVLQGLRTVREWPDQAEFNCTAQVPGCASVPLYRLNARSLP